MLNFVNLDFSLEKISDRELDSEVDKKLTWWPLLAAMSMCRANEGKEFHEEYLISHLFTEHVMGYPEGNSENIDGIMYASVNRKSIRDLAGNSYYEENALHRNPYNIGLLNNFVLFIKSNESQGYEPALSQKIHMTDPLSFQIVLSLGRTNGGVLKYQASMRDHELLMNFMHFGPGSIESHLRYGPSDFGRAEQRSKEDRFHDSMGPVISLIQPS